MKKSSLSFTEINESEFSSVINLKGIPNPNGLDFLQLKYFIIKDKSEICGYVLLSEVFNTRTKRKYWLLLNLGIFDRYQGKGLGSFALSETHSVLLSKLGAKSYYVSLSNPLMYRMIIRESLEGIVDFYCLVNDQYTVEEMKAEEQYLEQYLAQNPSNFAGMIVSFDKNETEKVKSQYFRT
ncbi:GNAT family N-acetyltransferase [Vibrio cholerae]|nr:GNAT family N-acetyltransferase [Vibrio cholerae]EKF9097193.1 GNAT family N-acetyltransferase [Vibrio cholerae]EKF9104177.1 GNAT family N-acetyltransferase [Vibrio cholerae]